MGGRAGDAAPPGTGGPITGPDAGDEIGPGLAVDETTDLKRGTGTACVSPQHSGVTRKTRNCVTWVFSALVTATGQCWAWFDLYMPECWAKDPARRKKAGIPRGLTFATKPDLAIAQVKAIIERGVRICWVAANEDLRPVGGLPGRLPGPVPVLRRDHPLRIRVTLARGTAPVRAAEAARGAVFERRSAGNGTEAPLRVVGTARHRGPGRIPPGQATGTGEEPVHVLLCRAAPGRPASLKYFVMIAARRWPIETSFKSGKDGLGWDQSQVTAWTAQNRHTLLTALAMIRIIFLRGFLARGITDGDPLPVPRQAPGRRP